VLVDKSAGMSSHDVVLGVRRRLGVRAVGHTGTLDPFATGLLILLLGGATRLARFLSGRPKRYLATVRLGVRTTTDDLTGAVVAQVPEAGLPHQARVLEELAAFYGPQLQRPPLYSAKHVEGERSYRRARRGEAVELAPVTITIHRIEPVEYRAPDLRFRAEVSAGTYLRSIARDLGDRLGVGAHLTALRREAIGSIEVEQAIPLQRVGPDAVLPAHEVLADLPRVELDDAARKAVAHGQAVVDGRAAGQRGSGAVALLAGGALVAVARQDNGWLHPTVVLEAPGSW
jgi:tRNA pseudouridine55 synthase